MARIFLSYCREDAEVVRPVAQELEQAGHSVWWDRHIKGGAQYAREIDQALASADAVLVLWSARSVESAWVRDEAEAGRDSGRLVPVSIDDSRPPLGFRQYQTIDLRWWLRTRDAVDLEELLGALSGTSDGKQWGAAGQSPPGKRATRRTFLAGAGAVGAVGLAGGAALLYRRFSVSPVPPEVEALMLQAKQLMEQNTVAGQNQAIGLLQRVVKLMPDYADGWGRLGIAYAVPSHYRKRSEALTLRARAESAGRRALEIDPRNVFGELSMAIALPFVGHWAERDQRLKRALANAPENDEVLQVRAVAMQFDGRPSESVTIYKRISGRPYTPAVYNNYILALWSAGRLAELDQALEDAASLYPTQWSIWSTRYTIYAYGGRADAAIALLENAEGRPSEVDDGYVGRLTRIARAVASRDQTEIGTIMAVERDRARQDARAAEYAIRNASALGRLDDAFEIAAAYYFGRAFAIPDFADDGGAFSPEQRQTRFLFEPVTEPMRADPRFEPLVREMGFDHYWRESGNQPDYRRSRQA